MKKRFMRDKEQTIINELTRFLELPKEITLDLPLVSLIGRQEVNIENFKGVLEYSAERVRINTSCGVLIIEGKNLEISEITSEAVLITGVLTQLTFDF